jgi:uncharacterized flavoprotein (TIGR03862 family)
MEIFLSRYGHERAALEPMITEFGPQALQEWAHTLGIETYVGSSGRVFPKEMKAAPLLRAWLHRLRAAGVRFHMRHRWTGVSADGAHQFEKPDGLVEVRADATLLAMGGGSWSKLGSTGAWVSVLSAADVKVAPLKASNCGFEINWSEHMRKKFAGEPVKTVEISFTALDGAQLQKTGDFVISEYGIEGSLIYAFSSAMVGVIEQTKAAVIKVDLLPAISHERLVTKLSAPRGKQSQAAFLRKQAGISGVKSALLYECLDKSVFTQPERLAEGIKALPIKCERARPIDEAISTAGGVMWSALNQNLMLKKLPGVFCAGEMLDWDAPTGGYLLTASFSSGYAAGNGVVEYCNSLKTDRRE